MKRFRRWQRIFILFFLSLSVFAPLVLVSIRLKTLTSEGSSNFVEDLPSIMQQYKSDALQLNAVEQEAKEGVKEPKQEVYRDQNYSVVNFDQNQGGDSTVQGSRASDGKVVESGSQRRGTQQLVGEEVKPIQLREELVTKTNEAHSNQMSSQHDHGVRAPPRPDTRRATDEKVKQMKDQVIRARAYLSFATAASNTHLVKELKLRIKEVERAMGEARKDSELSRSRLQKIKSMENTLSKANHVFPDCSNMVNKLRAMTHSAEEQVQSQRKQTTFLTELAGRTTPKGLHCLSMRLTTDYFMLQSEKQKLPKQQNVYNPDLHHYVTFSDNVLAAAVVVNSTVSNAMEPERVVFHVVTDSLNFPAFSMWFLLNPPGKATVQVLNMQDFQWWQEYESSHEKQGARDPRYSSLLNHLRFYLPEIFPQLDKIVFLDHDVVVQRDLSGLWTIDMKGKVNGAVETCQEDKSSFRRMAMFINFSDPLVARKFDANACTWAFGVNLFDLRQWRHHDLTSSYRRFLQEGNGRPLWKAGSLPLGWVTFYNQTVALDQRWHLLGLGFDSVLRLEDIEQAAVLHYDGIMKPWLDIGIKKYKGYWNKFANYDHPYMQQCNLHG
ncbi:probable galacturonosyltransferase 6 isoform X1 [Chenopodium quinoa]|uniref:probable galacturonosyltransferase 6 isoform X1 n=1 Tax=Chenopodium quinoa TaxID=63459 RepID=UPI000B78658B|nr:probable galacturonosyltransferase 6 isoform X1 [Chenopodium quinoa]